MELSNEKNTNEKIELVNLIMNSDILSLDDVRQAMKEKQLENIILLHDCKIWQGKDGRWRTHVDDPNKKDKRKLVAKKDKITLLEYLVEFYGESKQKGKQAGITLEELYPKWLRHKALHTTAENYIARIEREWKRFYEGTELAGKDIAELGKLYLDEWAHALIKEHDMSKKQYFNCTVIIRQALDYAVDLELLESNPFSKVKINGRRMFRKVRKKADETQVFMKGEVDMIFSLAWHDFHESTRLVHRLAPLAILFQFQTGVRLGELCALRYEDWEQSDYIHIQRMYRYETGEVVEHTKTADGDRQVLLTDEAQRIIETAKNYQTEHGLPNDGYIFSINDKPLSHSCVGDLYRKYCAKTGIVNKSSHKTRKTYISCLIDGQININTIRKMVGHADERTTLNCYCYDRSTEDEKARKIRAALVF